MCYLCLYKNRLNLLESLLYFQQSFLCVVFVFLPRLLLCIAPFLDLWTTQTTIKCTHILNLWYLCSQKTLQQLRDSNIQLTPPDLFKDICATVMISTENSCLSFFSLYKMITLYSQAPFVNIIHSSQFNNAVIPPLKSSISCRLSH